MQYASDAADCVLGGGGGEGGKGQASNVIGLCYLEFIICHLCLQGYITFIFLLIQSSQNP